MSSIYHGAKLVHVWLGESHDKSRESLQLLRELAMLSSKSRDNAPQADCINESNKEALDATSRLFCRSYWSRVWVIQEIVSASDIMVHCGPDTISWVDLANARDALHDKSEALAAIYYNDIGSTTSLLGGGPSTFIHPSIDKKTGVPKFDLEKLLLTHQEKCATNPKDRVFALVGISKARDDPNFFLDYSRTVQDIYTNAVEYVISSAISLTIICAPRGDGEVSNLPSWVPDWTVTRPADFWWGDSDFYLASGARKAHAIIARNGKVLSASGFILGSIAHSQCIYRSSDNDFDALINRLYELRDKVLRMKGFEAEHQHSIDRTLHGSSISYENEVLGSMGLMIKSSYPALKVDKLLEETVTQTKSWFEERGEDWEKGHVTYLMALMKSLYGRYFFLFEDGKLMGNASTEVKIEDVVVILFGCNYPVVIRKRDEGGWVYVAEAYVHGVMRGQALKDLEKGKYEETVFDIW